MLLVLIPNPRLRSIFTVRLQPSFATPAAQGGDRLLHLSFDLEEVIVQTDKEEGMVMMARRSGGALWSLKAVMVGTGFISAGLVLKIFVPLMIDVVFSSVPRLWSSLCLWMTPPYLYIVINAIILTIAASSSLQQKFRGESDAGFSPKVVEEGTSELDLPAGLSKEDELLVLPVCDATMSKSPAPALETVTLANATGDDDNVEEEDFIVRSNWSPTRRPSEGDTFSMSRDSCSLDERPSFSMRFGHRRSVKGSPDGKALGVARPRRQETLESTWKTITDGRSIPLARHLKKSETFDTLSRERLEPATPPLKKSETMKDCVAAAATLSPSPGSGRISLRRVPSPSQDELNRRVEAFIKKFNEEMRLQRQ